MLRAAPAEGQGAAFFLAKRLENYGQNPVDYPALTRDVGRLFLGKDLQCAQCHDHLFIDDYKQADFQGLFAFVQNAYLADAKTRGRRREADDGQARVHVGLQEGAEARPARAARRQGVRIRRRSRRARSTLSRRTARRRSPGVPKFSPLAMLAEELPAPDNPDFTRNIGNRLWFLLMGRGLVHPLDLHHTDNPPSHPELLDLLAKEFVGPQVRHQVAAARDGPDARPISARACCPTGVDEGRTRRRS